MFGIGWTEIAVVFILALLVFGPRRLPEIGRSIGKALSLFKEATRDVRRSMAEVQSEFESEIREARRAKEELGQALLEDNTTPEHPGEWEDDDTQPKEAEEDSDGKQPPDPPPSGSSLAG